MVLLTLICITNANSKRNATLIVTLHALAVAIRVHAAIMRVLAHRLDAAPCFHLVISFGRLEPSQPIRAGLRSAGLLDDFTRDARMPHNNRGRAVALEVLADNVLARLVGLCNLIVKQMRCGRARGATFGVGTDPQARCWSLVDTMLRWPAAKYTGVVRAALNAVVFVLSVAP